LFSQEIKKYVLMFPALFGTLQLHNEASSLPHSTCLLARMQRHELNHIETEMS